MKMGNGPQKGIFCIIFSKFLYCAEIQNRTLAHFDSIGVVRINWAHLRSYGLI